RSPGRLERGDHLEEGRQQRAAPLHDNRAHFSPHLHAHARPTIQSRDFVAERGVQSAATPELPHRTRDERPPSPGHHDTLTLSQAEAPLIATRTETTMPPHDLQALPKQGRGAPAPLRRLFRGHGLNARSRTSLLCLLTLLTACGSELGGVTPGGAGGGPSSGGSGTGPGTGAAPATGGALNP